MKIYFDGCSWTKGAELENFEEERYSRLICNELGAEETNLAMNGGSNDRIIRNLIVENNIEEYDLAVIQMTFPARTEYYNPDHEDKWWGDIIMKGKKSQIWGKWFKVNPDRKYVKWLHTEKSTLSDRDKIHIQPFHKNNFYHYRQFWEYYYKTVSNEKYFEVKEKIQYETIKGYCKSKGIPLILCTINQFTKLDFHFVLCRGLKKHRHGHPNKFGHQTIANNIIEQWKTTKDMSKDNAILGDSHFTRKRK